MKQETFDKVTKIIADICEIDAGTIRPDQNAIVDLEIDSLDFLDITFEVDSVFEIKLPVAEWTDTNEEVDEEKLKELFRLENICDYIDYLVEEKANEG